MSKLKSGKGLPKTEDDAINAGIAADPDNTELTKEWFKKAKPASELFDTKTYSALAAMKRPRGRPVVSNPKIVTAIRLDADVLDAFKATGKGWQTKINAALKQYMKEHSLEK